jgi:hypothetical protein
MSCAKKPRAQKSKHGKQKLSANTVAPLPMPCEDVVTPVANSSTGKNLRMKLLVDTKSNRVLYAEAGKDVVDFLFSLLTLPIATVSRLLTPGSMVGSAGNLYHSVECLDSAYVCRNDAKAAPHPPVAARPSTSSSSPSRMNKSWR